MVSGFPGGYAVLIGDHAGNNRFYSLIGSDGVLPVVERLLDMSRSQGYDASLRRVPKVVADNLAGDTGMVVREDRDNFDYLLSVSYLAGLEGSKNQSRRRLIRKFLDEHGDSLEVRRLDLTDPKAASDIISCTSEWISLRAGKNPLQSMQEKNAIARVLESAGQLPVRAFGFYADGAIRAFSIFEYLHSSTGVVHFEKCDLRLKGIASYVRHRVAKEFLQDRMLNINYEQDLGIEGLRKAKQMLHPADFLKKYTISA